MRRIAIVFALMAAFAAPASAQRGGGMKWLDGATLDAAKELAGDLVTWARADVVPTAQSWKNQLDNAMAPADLAKLNGLRRQALELKNRQIALVAAMRDAWKTEDYDALKTARTELKGLRERQKALVVELKPIAEANRATLENIGVAARPKIQEWTTDAREIGEKWYERNKETISPPIAMAIGKLMNHRKDLMALVEPKLRTKAAVARFMLWSGEDFTRDVENLIKSGGIEQLNELNLE